MKHFKISKEIEELDITNIKSNLFEYPYTTKTIKKLIQNNEPKDTPEFIAAYTSFKGEIFENVIYEHLINYAYNQREIIAFVLKGPYQNQTRTYYKSGLMLDNSAQIVYKSAYKDISEFDALFFTEDSVYFVEMSTSKKTDSLIKRLYKKSALLKMLFPNLEVRALIVLTQGSKGISKFPSYSTVWLTKDIEDEELINDLIFDTKDKKPIYTKRSSKFIQTYKVKYSKFQYFQTLEEILNESRKNQKYSVDLNYFKNEQMNLYFDIFTKLYIGYIEEIEFVKLVPSYNLTARDSKVIVTIEKINLKLYDIVYYVKEKSGKLKRFYVVNDEVKIKEKEPDGFTNAEVRFLYNVLKPEHILISQDILKLKKVGVNFKY